MAIHEPDPVQLKLFEDRVTMEKQAAAETLYRDLDNALIALERGDVSGATDMIQSLRDDAYRNLR